MSGETTRQRSFLVVDGSSEELAGVVEALRERGVRLASVETDSVSLDPIRRNRMDAALRTSGAISHEVANYLGTVQTMTYLLSDELPEGSESRGDLDIIIQMTKSAERFIKQLRAFAHPEPLGEGPADLNAALREAEPRLRALVRAEARLEVSLAEGALWVRADAARIEGVVADLVTRANEALGADGGLVEIATSRAEDALPVARLVVRDNGRGLDPEKAPRIFEPFVMSRASGGGLALPTTWAVVTESGGSVSAESTVEAGTTVRIDLPLSEAPESNGGGGGR